MRGRGDIARRWAGQAALVCLMWGGAALGADLSLPEGARTSYTETLDPDGYDLPVGVWQGRLPIRRVEGRVDRIVYRIPDAGPTVLQTVIPLRRQLDLQGYDLLFECADQRCGGFDFRFATEVIPAPDMYVNMSDFHFLAAQDGQTGRAVTVLVSRSSTDRFVQVIRVAPSQARRAGGTVSTASRRMTLRPVARGEAGLAPNTGPVTGPVTGPGLRHSGGTGGAEAAHIFPSPPLPSDGPVGAILAQQGHLVLDDLVFASGAGGLGPGPFQSLAGLAAFLREDQARRVVLVGHTDAVGSLESNLALSRRRAQATRTRLVDTYQVRAAQVMAEGMGYLAPRASNLTEAGRIANRRVEVVLLP